MPAKIHRENVDPTERERGILGTVSWFFVQTETNSRKNLHSHWLMKVVEMHVTKKQLQEQTWRDKLVEVIDSILSASLLSNIDCSDVDEATRESRFKLEESIRQAKPDFPPKTSPLLWYPPVKSPGLIKVPYLDTSIKLQDQEPAQHILSSMLRNEQHHMCTDTCRKGFNKKKCRVRNSKVPVARCTTIDSNGLVRLRRDVSRTVATSHALSYSLRCNTKCEFLPLGGCVGAHHYACKYTVKTNDSITRDLHLIQRGFARKFENAAGKASDDTKAGNRLVQALTNSLLANMQFSAVEIAQDISQIDDHIFSHSNHVYLNWESISSLLASRHLIDLHELGLHAPTTDLRWCKDGNTRSFASNYCQINATRNRPLLPPYTIAMWFTWQRKSTISRSPHKQPPLSTIEFSDIHPDCADACLIEREEIAVPILLSIPKQNDLSFKLFIVLLCTTLAAERFHNQKAISRKDIHNRFNSITKIPWVQALIQNIRSWQQAETDAVQLAKRRALGEEEEEEHEELHQYDSSRSNLQEEAELDLLIQRQKYQEETQQDNDNQEVALQLLAGSTDDFLGEDQDIIVDGEGNPVDNTPATESEIWTRQGVQILKDIVAKKFPAYSESHDPFSRLQDRAMSMAGDCTARTELQKPTESATQIHRKYRLYNSRKAGGEINHTKQTPSQEELVQLASLWYKNDSEDPARCLDPVTWQDMQTTMLSAIDNSYTQTPQQMSTMDPVKQITEMIATNHWYQMSCEVKPEQVVRAFGLTQQQAIPFFVFADYAAKLASFIQNPVSYHLPEPLLLNIDGAPGSGKSYLMKAMSLYSMQLRLESFLRASAQTARAAVNMSTPILTARTNHFLFSIACDTSKKNSTQLPRKPKSLLQNGLIFLVDESSLIPSDMLALMHQQLAQVSTHDYTRPFGGKSLIFFGDTNQLVLRNALWKKNPTENLDHNSWDAYQTLTTCATTQMKQLGRALWTQCQVFTLKEVNRFLPSAGGQTLAEIVINLRNGEISEHHLDMLNDRVITINSEIFSYSTKPPYFLSARNSVLTEAANYMLIATGLASNTPVLTWPCLDLNADGHRKLTPAEARKVASLTWRQTKCFSTFVFFVGARYAFTENKYHSVHWINQCEATCVGLDLHPDEPDYGNNSFVKLHYMPLAIYLKVEPATSFDLGYGENILKLPRSSCKFKADTLTIYRHGFTDIVPACTKSDYGAQCMTIQNPTPVILDLAFPVRGKSQPGSLLVMLSRAQSLDQLFLARPLYTDSESRSKFLKKMKERVKLPLEKKQEMERLDRCTVEFIEIHKSHVTSAERYGTAARPGTLTIGLRGTKRKHTSLS